MEDVNKSDNWTPLQTFNLIKAFKQYDALYRPSHPDFSNPLKRREYFHKMATDMQTWKRGVNYEDIESRIKYMDRELTLERKRQINHIESGNGDSYKPRLWYYNLLNFVIEAREESKEGDNFIFEQDSGEPSEFIGLDDGKEFINEKEPIVCSEADTNKPDQSYNTSNISPCPHSGTCQCETSITQTVLKEEIEIESYESLPLTPNIEPSDSHLSSHPTEQYGHHPINNQTGQYVSQTINQQIELHGSQSLSRQIVQYQTQPINHQIQFHSSPPINQQTVRNDTQPVNQQPVGYGIQSSSHQTVWYNIQPNSHQPVSYGHQPFNPQPEHYNSQQIHLPHHLGYATGRATLQNQQPLNQKPSPNENKLQNTNDQDDHYHFFALNLAAQLRKLPMKKALELEAKITSLLVTKRLQLIGRRPFNFELH